MEILAALLVRERPRDLPVGDLEQIGDVEGPDPNTAARAGGGEFRTARTEGHSGYGAADARQDELLRMS